jgi:ATP-dependent Clp protease protease subunit
MKKNELVCFEKETSKTIESKDALYIFVTKFDDEAASKFFDQFTHMSSSPEVKVIPIVISSFGGQVHSLLPMIDLIKACDKPVATIALGKAMSCGAFLLGAGTKGYRYAAPNADIMLHEVSSSGWDKTSNLENDVEHTRYLNDLFFNLLAKWAGKKDKNFFLKELKSKSNVDWYLTASEFKKYGLIDHVGIPNLIKR